jgi:hypothetical protein
MIALKEYMIARIAALTVLIQDKKADIDDLQAEKEKLKNIKESLFKSVDA